MNLIFRPVNDGQLNRNPIAFPDRANVSLVINTLERFLVANLLPTG
jgi:hypothetical protein